MKQILKALFIGSLLLATPAQSAFVDQYVGNYEASKWPEGFKIYIGRESKALFTQTGDPTAYTFVAHARADSSSTTALIAGTVTTSADNGGSITIAFSDDQTTNLLNSGRKVYVTLDVLIGGEYFPVAAGYVPAEPIGSQLPVEVTPIEFEDMLSQLEAQVALAEAAATAAETAQAAAEAAAASATGIGDGDKGDITVSSGGSVWKVDEAGVTQHQAALSLNKSQISDFSDGDYATAAQGALADSSIQPGDNVSGLINDSGFITGYTVTEGDVTGVLSGATLTDAGTPASDDKILIQDTSDTNSLKYVSFDEFGGGGGVDWTETQESAQTDGASSTAFSLNSSNPFSLGNLFDLSNNGSSKFVIDANGWGEFGGRVYPSVATNPSYSSYLFAGNNYITMNASNGVSFGVGIDTTFTVSVASKGFVFTRNYSALGSANTPGISVQDQTFDASFAPSNVTLKAQSVWPSAVTFPDGGHVDLSGGEGSTTGDRGHVRITSSESAIDDADLSASQMAFFIDEASDKLIIKAKYADGTTVKTFEVAANP